MPDDLDAYLNPAPRAPRRGTKLSPDQIATTLRTAGWDEQHIPTMTAIAQAESSGNPDAHNAKYPDDSYGLLQVNRLAHPQYSPATLRDPLGNAKAALDVFKKQGLRAWSTYTNGAYKNHLSQRLSSAQKPTSDLDGYLDPQASSRTPPQTSEQRPSPSVPSITDAMDVITANVNRATRRLERHAVRQPASRPINPLFQQFGQQRVIEQGQRAQETQAREEAKAELASQRGPYGSPTLTGILNIAAHPLDSLTGIFTSDEDKIAKLTAEKLRAQQLAAEPEVTSIRKEYGGMPAAGRAVVGPLARGGAGLLRNASGIASAFGIAPNRLSDWASKRAEIIEAGAANTPLRESRNLGSLVTGDSQLEEVQRGVPEKLATGLADLGVGIGQIVLLQKATGLSLPKLLALEGAAKASDKPVQDQLAAATEGYALGSALNSHLSRGASAVLFGAPTAAQTGYEVAQGRMSPVDAAIQTGVQAGAGAVLGRGGRAETPTQARLTDLATEAGPRDEVSTATNPLRSFRRPYGREGEVRATTPQPPRNEIQGRDLNPTEFLRVIQAERKPRGPQTEIQSPMAAQRAATQPAPAAAEAVPTRPAVDRMDAEIESVRGSVPETARRFYHRDYGEVEIAPSQAKAGRGRVKIVDEQGREHYVRRADLNGRGNQRMVPIREPAPEPPLSQYLEPQGQPAVEPALSPATESPSSLQVKGELTTRVQSPEEVAGGPLSASGTRVPIATEPVTKEPQRTAPKNAAMAADRAELGLPELERVKGTSAQQVLDNATEANRADPRRPDVLVEQALRGGKNFTDTETMQVNLRAAEVKNDIAKLKREIASATDDATVADKSIELESRIDEFTRLSEAQQKAGKEWSQAGRARQKAVDENLSLIEDAVTGFRRSAKRKETPAERVEIEQRVAKEIETLAKIEKANERIAQERLQDEINKTTRRQRLKRTAKSLNDEFAQLQTQFAQVRAETRDIQPSGLAGLDPEGKLTALIAKMARNRIEAGVNKAEALVDEVYEAVKAHLPASVTRDDIKAAISDFRKDQSRQRAIGRENADLQRRMSTSDFSDKPQREPPRYTRETARLQRELEQNRAKYARMRYKATRSTGGKITDELAKAANVPKTLKSIGDVSAMFRQGGYYAITHPIAGLAKPTQAMLRSFTDTGWRNVEAMIKADPTFTKLRDAGVEFTGVDKADPALNKREEGYLGGEYLDYIPVAKQVKDFSERTFVSFLDAQRLHVGKTILDGMTAAQRANPAEVKAVARLINIATGRGELGKRGNQLAPALNIAMFSPRLLASRVQLLNNMLNPVTIARMPAGARKAMIADNVKFLAATGALLGLAKAAGATVSTDPDDAEFLKIRVGNTVYDTLTGLQQPLRYIANMARAASPVDGRPLQSGSDYYAGRNMAEMSKQFARSKLNPALAPAIDFISGQDFEGRKFSAGRELRDLAIPLPAKDVYEGLREGGIVGGLQATPTFVGIGVGSYPPAPDKPHTHAEKLVRKLLREGMPASEAREEEQIETDREKAQLRARSRAGENVNAELVKLIREGKITDKQAKRVMQAKGRTRLSEDLKTLDPDESLRVYSVMDADERRVSGASIKQKIANSKADAERKRKFRERARKLGLVQ